MGETQPPQRGLDPWDRGVPWYLRALNDIRRFFGRAEKRYLTDAEWREHMRAIIPKNPPSHWRDRPSPIAEKIAQVAPPGPRGEEMQLRAIIDGAVRAGVHVPAAAAVMLRQAELNDLRRRVEALEAGRDAKPEDER